MSTIDLSIGDIVSQSWEAIKKNIWIFAGTILGFTLVIFLIFVLFGGIGVISMGNVSSPEDISGILAGIFGFSFLLMLLLVFVLSCVFMAGYYNMALMAADGQEATFSAFSVSFKKILNLLLGAILYAIIVWIGFILCVIPGIIVGARLITFYFFIIDKDYNAIDALSKSWEATKGNTLNLILLYIVFYLINMLGALCCGIGIFVTAPMQVIGLALVYRKLTGIIPQDVDFDSLSTSDSI